MRITYQQKEYIETRIVNLNNASELGTLGGVWEERKSCYIF